MQPLRVKAFLTVMVTALAAGCSSPGSDRSPVSTVVDTVDGVVHVRNAGPAPAWTPTLVARIGSDTEGPAAFGRIRAITADAAGNVYVADNMANVIQVFAEDGRHLRTIGRRGSGPGEFNDLYSIAWLDEQLVVMDPRNSRLSILTAEGAWVRGISGRIITGPATVIRLFPLGDAGAYTPVINAENALAFARLTGGGFADTIAPPPRPADAQLSSVMCRRSDGGITGISPTELPSMIYAFPPPGGAIATAWTEHYAVATLASTGDTMSVVTRDLAPMAYPDSLWEHALERLRTLHREYPGTQCEPAAMRRPPTRAVLRHLVFDETGRMWIEVATSDGFAWDVFSSDGRLLGSAPAPARSTAVPPYVSGNRLYLVQADSLGVQYVAVYSIGPI